MIKRLATATLLSISFWSFTLQADTDAAAVVTRFHDSLITMMKTQGYEARSTLMIPIITENFDTRTVARVSLGRNWRTLSREEQDDLTGLLTELLVSSYSNRFPAFSSQKFEIGRSTPIIPDRMIVESELYTGSELIKLDYQLIELDGEWKIFDVVAEGVSDLALKRSSFAEAFREEGLGGVIAEIKETIIEDAQK